MDAFDQWYDDVFDYASFFHYRRPKIAKENLHGVARAALESLRYVARRDIRDAGEVHLQVAACVNRFLSGYLFNWEKMDTSVEILEAMAIRNPENVDIQIQFAKGAVNVLRSCVHFSKQVDKAIEMQAIFQKLKAVVPERFQNHEEIKKLLLEGQALLERPAS
jgi:hypothetical protein